MAIRGLLRALRHLTLILLACRNMAANPRDGLWLTPAQLLAQSSTATWTQIRHTQQGWTTQSIFDMDLDTLRHGRDNPAAQLLWLLDEHHLVTPILLALELTTFRHWTSVITQSVITAELHTHVVLNQAVLYNFMSYILTLGTVLQTRYRRHRNWVFVAGAFDALTDEMNYYLWMHRRFSILEQ